MAKREALRVLFWTGAAIAVGWAAAMLWTVGKDVSSLVASGYGSGGIGAVSFGLGEIVLPFAAGAVGNLLLARKARRTGGAVLALHRAHSTLLLVLLGLTVMLVALLPGLMFLNAGLGPVSALITILLLQESGYAAQLLLLAAILALFARAPQQPGD